MDTPSTSTTTPVHLLVLMHGMWGNPAHLAEAAKFIRDKADSRTNGDLNDNPPLDFQVLVAHANQEGSTYDGIDWGGERIADEITEHVEKLQADNKKVTRFSVLGYSLGGLLGRYVIGILQARKFFDNVKPVNFNTIATPHIGLPKYSGTLFASLINTLGPRMLSRTGEQFFAIDKWSNTEKPLLEVMVEPDSIFMQALKKFDNIAIYANAVNDLTVPYVTASINEENIYIDHAERGIEIEYIEGYKPLVASYSYPDTPPPKVKGPKVFSKAWFKTLKDYRPPLPPFMQRPFPLNLVLFAAIPVLLPTFICMALVRLSLESRKSRARIRLLEEDAENPESGHGRLITLINKLEKEMDDAVAEFVAASGPEPDLSLSEGGHHFADKHTNGNAAPGSSSETIAVEPETNKDSKESDCSTASKKGKKAPSLLKPCQKRMVELLNSNLRQMKKYDAYIHPIRNSHGTIIVRDPKGFDFHRIGEGVLRHYSDHFAF